MRYLLICLIASAGFVQAQRDIDSVQSAMELDFEKYVDSETKKFNDFREKENEKFARFLNSNWTEFTEFTKFNKPKKPPIPPADDVPNEPSKKIDSVESNKSNPVVKKIPDSSNEFENPVKDQEKSYEFQNEFQFYGGGIELGYSNALLVEVSEVSKNGISNYWKTISSSDYQDLLSQLRGVFIRNNYADWQVFQFIRSFSSVIHSDAQSQIALQFFLLNQLGYDVKIAIQGNSFILLLPIEQKVYGKYSIVISGKRYYLWGGSNASLYTIKEKFNSNNEQISLLCESLPFNSGRELSRVMKLPNGQGVMFKLNKGHLDYLSDFPQCELSVHFNTPLTENLKRDIHAHFDPILEGKSDMEKANFLLQVMHRSFKYKTDDEQFGKEKWFFPEESIFYPFSDCEDRSVMFAKLIVELTDLEVIGLYYEDHVATALHLEKPIGDCIKYEGKLYSVFDPSYINAKGGMSMGRYKKISPEVIEVIYK